MRHIVHVMECFQVSDLVLDQDFSGRDNKERQRLQQGSQVIDQGFPLPVGMMQTVCLSAFSIAHSAAYWPS